eukprot:TRINITY_DN15991_c0_g1_i1.p1 TRINITY_DN15991_c0_g1~~TRINITY_DN15991_c0_g1_i1.p1  ORF type:complete len:209 (-),score=84.54 TRINITY_DN15991_c0_g1_i1:16-570(-)
MVQTISFIKISTFIFLSLVISCSSRRSPYHVRPYYKPSYQPAKLTPALAKSSSCSSNPFLSTCSSLSLNPRWLYSDLGGGVLLPEDSIPARGRREKLFRRYHYLQYIRLVFQKLKKEYAREYYGVAVPDFTADYSYDDYDDYLGVDVGLGDLFARQVKKDEKEKEGTEDFEFDYEDFEATESIN